MINVLAWVVGVLFGLAVADFWKAIQGVEAPAPNPAVYRTVVHPMLDEMTAAERDRSTCLYLPQKDETYSIVVPQGVTCVTRVEAK